MPANKEAYIRFRIIDKLLRHKQKPYPTMEVIIDTLYEQLGKEFSVSTIQKDIKAMREDELLGFKAPIKFSKKHMGYYYEDENYSLNIPLTEQDIDALELAGQALRQYKNISAFNELGNAVEKIFNAINIHSVLNEKEIESFVQFETSTETKGTEFLSAIMEHIKNRQPVSIEYKRFDSDVSKQHLIHPYLLKEYKNRWYVIGKRQGKDYVMTLALDRIISLNLADIPFKKDNQFSAKSYFKHAYGITTFVGKPEKVVLQFEQPTGSYVLTSPLHKTQNTIKQNEEVVEIEIEVGITTELIMDILSFGEWVKVLKPATLKEELSKKLKKMQENYG